MGLDRLRQRRSYALLVRLGLISYGLVSVVTAGLALQVAGGADARASSAGALREVSRRPLGVVLVWSMGIGLLVLALWQVIEAAIGGANGTRWTRRLACLGRASTYAVLGLLALGAAAGADQHDNAGTTMTARVLDLRSGGVAVGVLLIIAVGAATGAVGVAQIVRGVRRRFTEDLTREAGRPTVVFGVVGLSAKGLVLVMIGTLLVAAALTRDPSDVGGMDVALARLNAQTFGPPLLVAMASGLACFGLYCFVWSGRARV